MNSEANQDPFAGIRPYYDHEVRGALDGLIESDEFIKAVIDARMGKKSKLLKLLSFPFVRQRIRRLVHNVDDIYGVQYIVSRFINTMLQKSVDNFTISGMEHISKEQPYLIVGNHRDIVLDPALINYALFTREYNTARIAIGDNLRSRRFIADLMRLNKSFIVKRSIKQPRERFKTYMELSEYIQYCLHEEQSSVWIAQSEGRAKNGRDVTQNTVIKMLALSKNKAQQFSEYIRNCNMLPVTISYEYDPCDMLKARELYLRDKEGGYEKAKDEDYNSILQSVNLFKGDIHISFGKPIEEDLDNAEEVAKAIDRQIISNYKLHSSNIIADYMQQNNGAIPAQLPNISTKKIQFFTSRLEAMPAEYRPYAIAAYGNIVALKRQIEENGVITTNSSD